MIEPVWLCLAAAAAGLAAGWWFRSRTARRDRARAALEWQHQVDLARRDARSAAGELARQGDAERELRRDLVASASTIDTLRTEIENHTLGLRDARQSRDETRQRCAELVAETELVRARWIEAAAAVDRLVERDREVRMLTESIAGIAARLDQAVAGRNTADADRTKAALQVETLERQLRDAASTARAERERSDTSRALQAAGMTDLRRRLEEAAAAKAAAEVERDSGRARGLEVERRVAELEGQIRQSELTYQQQLADLAAELGSARAQAERIEPLRRQVEDREARERELLGAIEDLETRVAGLIRLESGVGGLTADLEQARARVSELERDRDRLRIEQERATAQLASLRAEIRDRDTRFRLLLTDRRAVVEASQGEVARLKDMVTATRRRGAEPSDDLKRITGIGPSLERILRRHGVHSFRQIASWTEADIERVSRELGAFRSRIRRDQWIEQARREHERLYGERVEQ